MFEAAEFIKSYSQLKNSELLKETELSLQKNSVKAENLDKINQDTGMGPLEQQPSLDTHNQNFALINYESNSETLDNHVENEYSTIIMSSIHWTDFFEIEIL